MGGEGSIQGMIVILRNNKKLLRKRNPFRRGKGFERLHDDYRKFSQGQIETKTVTKSQLREIRRKVVQENRKENIRTWFIGIVVSIVAIGFTLMGYNGIQNYETELDEIEIKKVQINTFSTSKMATNGWKRDIITTRSFSTSWQNRFIPPSII